MLLLNESDALSELHARGATRLERVRFRANRRTIWSLTRGGTALNLHSGYRHATPALLDHFALITLYPRGGPESAHLAREAVRRHPPLLEALRAIRKGPNAATPDQQEYLDTLYETLNASHFDRDLPTRISIRLSRRMRSTLGWVRVGHREGRRVADELALNLDLMLEANDPLRSEVMLHEMAHIEAWLVHGDRGHGPAWRAIAQRIGCVPRARGLSPLIPRRHRSGTIERIPPRPGRVLATPPRISG